MERSFYDLDERATSLILENATDHDRLIHVRKGFSGCIYVFEDANKTPGRICCKIPRSSATVTPKEATRRFLREIKIQRQMYYHMFVHWPFDFDFIYDAPVAHFRYWNSDLSDLIEDGTFTTIGRLSMLCYLVSGLKHCHNRGLIAHQDLKPENIFVRDLRSSFTIPSEQDTFLIPKIADFGSANLAHEIGEFRGTRPYMAPEQWNKNPLGDHTTVWSIGIIAYELLSYGIHAVGEQSRPWRNMDQIAYKRWQSDKLWKRWINDGKFPAKPLPHPDLDGFVRMCLNMDPEQRPSLDDVYECLLALLRTRSQMACKQVEILIDHAHELDKEHHDWPYLDNRYDWLERQARSRFGDSNKRNDD